MHIFRSTMEEKTRTGYIIRSRYENGERRRKVPWVQNTFSGHLTLLFVRRFSWRKYGLSYLPSDGGIRDIFGVGLLSPNLPGDTDPSFWANFDHCRFSRFGGKLLMMFFMDNFDGFSIFRQRFLCWKGKTPSINASMLSNPNKFE